MVWTRRTLLNVKPCRLRDQRDRGCCCEVKEKLPDSCLDRYTFKESLYVTQALQAYAFEYDVMPYTARIYVTVQDAKLLLT
jgi:hypothetical protein